MRPGDALLTCRDCGGSFIFSEDERRAFAVLGHRHAPSRCAACRAARKTRQAESGGPAIAPRFRELQQTPTTVICSACGESAVVPFAARAGRSVYCPACFQRRRREGDT
jgi:CxxC-x17-CxxC domain-containing protein